VLLKSVVGLGVSDNVLFLQPRGQQQHFTLCVIVIAQATNPALDADRSAGDSADRNAEVEGTNGFPAAGFVVPGRGTLSAMARAHSEAGFAAARNRYLSCNRSGASSLIGNGVAAIAIAAWEKDVGHCGTSIAPHLSPWRCCSSAHAPGPHFKQDAVEGPTAVQPGRDGNEIQASNGVRIHATY